MSSASEGAAVWRVIAMRPLEIIVATGNISHPAHLQALLNERDHDAREQN